MPTAPEGAPESKKHWAEENSLLKRVGHPEDVARTVLYLVDSDFATGATYLIDGGRALVVALLIGWVILAVEIENTGLFWTLLIVFRHHAALRMFNVAILGLAAVMALLSLVKFFPADEAAPDLGVRRARRTPPAA